MEVVGLEYTSSSRRYSRFNICEEVWEKGPIDNVSYFSVNACKLLYIIVSLFVYLH